MTEENKEAPAEEINDLDAILKGDDIFGIDEKPTESTPQKVEEKIVNEESDKESEDGIPELIGDDYPPQYLKMVNRVKIRYAQLPKLDHYAIEKELAELSIESSPTPTLQVLNDELYKVQSAKDRLANIVIEVTKCYSIKNRMVDILRDAWGKFSSEKNAESRKGDAAFRLSNFSIDFAEVEGLMKACNHVLRNLDSMQERLSRTITVYQNILKLRDMGRGGLPDYDFEKKEGKSELFEELNIGQSNITTSEEGGPKEIEF